jgi:hypothetical protein
VDRSLLASETVARIEEDIRSKERPRLSRGLEELATKPAVLAKVYPNLLKAVQELGAEEEMLARLLAPKAETWTQLSAVTTVGAGLAGTGFSGKFAEMVRRHASSLSKYEFGQLDYINRRLMDGEMMPLLRDLKYPGLPCYPTTRQSLFECAEAVADSILFNNSALDFLFANRSQKQMSRKTWEREIRLAWALDHLLMDFDFPLAEKMEFISSGTNEALLDAFKGNSADVVAYLHAGTNRLRFFFQRLFPRAYVVAGLSKQTVDGDSSGPIVQAMRHALRGGMVIIAPDGPFGKGTVEIEVFGRKTMLKPGAALLAYDSWARTSFFTLVREGKSFVPVLKFGPTRIKRETYGDYLCRYAQFYESCLIDFFSGPPQNLVFNGVWLNFFAGLLGKS